MSLLMLSVYFSAEHGHKITSSIDDSHIKLRLHHISFECDTEQPCDASLTIHNDNHQEIAFAVSVSNYYIKILLCHNLLLKNKEMLNNSYERVDWDEIFRSFPIHLHTMNLLHLYVPVYDAIQPHLEQLSMSMDGHVLILLVSYPNNPSTSIPLCSTFFQQYTH